MDFETEEARALPIIESTKFKNIVYSRGRSTLMNAIEAMLRAQAEMLQSLALREYISLDSNLGVIFLLILLRNDETTLTTGKL